MQNEWWFLSLVQPHMPQDPERQMKTLKQNIYLAEQGKVQQTLWNPILNSICRSHLRSGKTFGFLMTEKVLKWRDRLTKFQCDFVTGSHWVKRNRLLLTVTCLLFLFMVVPFSFRRLVCFCQMESKSPLWIQLFFLVSWKAPVSTMSRKTNRGLLRIYLKQSISGSFSTNPRPALVFVTKLRLLHLIRVGWLQSCCRPHLPPKEVRAMHNASKRAPLQHLHYPTLAM